MLNVHLFPSGDAHAAGQKHGQEDGDEGEEEDGGINDLLICLGQVCPNFAIAKGVLCCSRHSVT